MHYTCANFFSLNYTSIQVLKSILESIVGSREKTIPGMEERKSCSTQLS